MSLTVEELNALVEELHEREKDIPGAGHSLENRLGQVALATHPCNLVYKGDIGIDWKKWKESEFPDKKLRYFIYMLGDESDEVVFYVGKTKDPVTRLTSGHRDKPWWPQVKRVYLSVVECPDNCRCGDLEIVARAWEDRSIICMRATKNKQRPSWIVGGWPRA